MSLLPSLPLQFILILVSLEDFTRNCAFMIASCHLFLCCHSLQGFSAETALRLQRPGIECRSNTQCITLGNFYNFLDSFICKGGKCIRWSLKL